MYNVKVIHYPNGEMQLRHYSTPLVLKESSPYEEEHQEREYENYERNPFDNKLSRIVDDFADLDSITKENERRSYNRTKQNIFAYSRCALWEKFVTFTFNGAAYVASRSLHSSIVYFTSFSHNVKSTNSRLKCPL